MDFWLMKRPFPAPGKARPGSHPGTGRKPAVGPRTRVSPVAGISKISDEPSKSMDYDPAYVAYLREVFQVPEATTPSPSV